MKPRVLLLYYTLTNQTRRVAGAMDESFRQHGWETAECAIEFTDPRYDLSLPFNPFWRRMLYWIFPQWLGRTGRISYPEDILENDFDLVCIGSPTWWLKPAMPLTSFMQTESARRLLDGTPFAVFAVCRAIWWNNLRNVKRWGRARGGRFVGGAAFCFRGNQLRSMLSLIHYMKTGRDTERYRGIRIHPFGVTEDGLARARSFAAELAAEHETQESAP